MKRVIVVFLIVLLATPCLVDMPALATSPTENSWVTGAPLPQSLSGGKSAVVNGKIYIISAKETFEYDLATGNWIAKSPMPTQRCYFGIAVFQNKVYVIGGATLGSSHDSFCATSINEVYDPSNDSWSRKAPMPTSRAYLDANVVEGKIYLIGGASGTSLASENVNEEYDPANDSWVTVKPMLYPVSSYASTVFNDKIYIFSGTGQSLSDQTQIYTPTNDSWSLGAPIPNKVLGATAGATSGVMALQRIYVFGGAWGIPASNYNQVYDPLNNNWTYGRSMPTNRTGLTAAVIEDTFYLFGGFDSLISVGVGPIEKYFPLGFGSPDPIFLLEITLPKLSIISPLPLKYNESTVNLDFTIGKVVNWVGYSLDGERNVTIMSNITLAQLTNGRHTLIVYAEDTYGNIGASQNVTFTVDSQAVTQSFPNASVIATLFIVTAAIACTSTILYRVKKPKNKTKSA